MVSDGFIPDMSFHCMDIDGGIDMVAVASGFTGFDANPPHGSRKGIVLHNDLKRLEIITCLGMSHPGLDVFTGRACTVAGWHKINVNRSFLALGACALGMEEQVNRFGKVSRWHVNWFEGINRSLTREKKIVLGQSRPARQ